MCDIKINKKQTKRLKNNEKIKFKMSQSININIDSRLEEIRKFTFTGLNFTESSLQISA